MTYMAFKAMQIGQPDKCCLKLFLCLIKLNETEKEINFDKMTNVSLISLCKGFHKINCMAFPYSNHNKKDLHIMSPKRYN